MLDDLEDAISVMMRQNTNRELKRGLEDLVLELKAHRAILMALAEKTDLKSADLVKHVEGLCRDTYGQVREFEAEAVNAKVAEILTA